MKNNSYNKIEDYLSGNVSEAELLAFEKEMFENPELQQKVAISKMANQLVSERRLLDVKELAAQAHAESGNGFWKKTLILSTSALLVGASLYVFQDKKEDKKTIVITEKQIEVKDTSSKLITKTEIETSKEVEKQLVVVNKAKKIVSDKLEKKELPIETLKVEEINIKNNSIENIELKVAEKVHLPNVVKLNPCENVKITANVFANPACDNEANGSIVASSFGGGKSPYLVKVLDKTKQELQLSSLHSGTYEIVVSDANNCHTSIENVVVKSKVCDLKMEFNPFIGEKWEVPVNQVKGNLVVYDKLGNVYFSATIPAGNDYFWSGESSSGEMNTGYFLFKIDYNNGKVKQGSISIVR